MTRTTAPADTDGLRRQFGLSSRVLGATERESTQLLRDAVETGAIKDPIPRSILNSLVRNSKVAA